MTGAEIPIAMAVAPELLGAGAAAGAAGAGAAAGLGAGATAAGLGAGAAGLGGGTAALFGAGAPTLASSLLAPEAAAGLGAGMGGGTASLFGAGTAGVSPFAAQMATTPAAAAPGFNWMKAGQTVLNGASKGMGQQQQQAPAPGPRPPMSNAPMQSNQEILQRLKLQQMMGPRSNFASLLGGY